MSWACCCEPTQKRQPNAGSVENSNSVLSIDEGALGKGLDYYDVGREIDIRNKEFHIESSSIDVSDRVQNSLIKRSISFNRGPKSISSTHLHSIEVQPGRFASPGFPAAKEPKVLLSPTSHIDEPIEDEVDYGPEQISAAQTFVAQ